VGFRIKERGFNVKKYISLNKIRGEEPHLSKLGMDCPLSHTPSSENFLVYDDHFDLLTTKKHCVKERKIRRWITSSRLPHFPAKILHDSLGLLAEGMNTCDGSSYLPFTSQFMYGC
jgi:hypothetical protein